MKRKTCGGCGSEHLHQFLDLGASPIADAYTYEPDEASKTYPLQVAVCLHCRLVQLLEVVDSKTLFGTGYSFFSSSSQPLSDYHFAYAQQVLDRHANELRGGFVLEVGCNDGDMLRWFAQSGISDITAIGVDPAEGPVNAARERGLFVIQKEFSARIARDIKFDYGLADVVIANHVLAHVADVADFLRGIAIVLAPDGVAYVEVQYVADLLVNNAFDLVYHEHRNFFSLISMGALAARAGLAVEHVEFTRRQQGSIRVTLRHSGDTATLTPVFESKLESEWWLRAGTQAYDGLQGRVERVRTRLWDMLHDVHGSIAGYGAPAKATTLLNYCEIDANVLRFVVDSTPAKQERYVPGTGIQIVSPELEPEDVPDAFLLLAWNYAHEILTREHRNGLSWIVPLPAPLKL